VSPKSLLQGLELMEESHRILCSVYGRQPTLTRDVEHAAGEHPLERRLGRSVRPPHATAGSRLGPQLHRRLKKVHIQTHCPIQLGQPPIGTLTLESIVADELPNDRAIFLLDLCELRDYADQSQVAVRLAGVAG